MLHLETMRHRRIALLSLVLLITTACNEGEAAVYEVRADRAARPNDVGTGLDRCRRLSGVTEAIADGESNPPVGLTFIVKGNQEADEVATCLRSLSYDGVTLTKR